MINRSYKYRIIPNNEQIKAIAQILKCTTKIRNMYLNDVFSGKRLPTLAKTLINEYLSVCPELNDTDNSALFNELLKLMSTNELTKFKTKKGNNSYSTYFLKYKKDRVELINDNILYLPKVGNVKIIMHRPLPKYVDLKCVTVIKNNSEYYACVLFSFVSHVSKRQLDIKRSIGLDYSSTHFIVDSNGNKMDALRFYRSKQEELSKLQNLMSLAQKKNNGDYLKYKRKYQKLNRKIRNQRNDYLHKLSTYLANAYDYIFIEDLNLNDIAQSHSLGKATLDNSYGLFIKMIDYKMKDRGKRLYKISKWFPSSKTCHCCGAVNSNVVFGVKEWVCPNCGAKLDRDRNAAINIKIEGIRSLT